jgi:dihydroneopterin aldolase
MADRIRICDLEVFFRVGVPEAERASPQRLTITLELHRDFAAATARDDLSQTIDYSAVARRLRALGQDRQWRLIESLAVEIAEILQTEFDAQRVDVEVKKFILPEARYVSVAVQRPA